MDHSLFRRPSESETKRCVYCGVQTRADAEFCRYCGKEFPKENGLTQEALSFFESRIDANQRHGFKLVSRDETTATMMRKKTFDTELVVLWLMIVAISLLLFQSVIFALAGVLGLVAYATYYLRRKDQVINLKASNFNRMAYSPEASRSYATMSEAELYEQQSGLAIMVFVGLAFILIGIGAWQWISYGSIAFVIIGLIIVGGQIMEYLAASRELKRRRV